MTVFKCKMCGGNLKVSEGISIVTCEYCGCEQTLPTSNDEEILNLYEKANDLRLNREFDKSTEAYEKILDLDYTQAEAHWGIVLCKYGIIYVDSGRHQYSEESKKPTCLYTHLTPISTDANYLACIKYADSVSASLYEREAQKIWEIQKAILDIREKEEPFDVFICYKAEDEFEKTTRDNDFANEIYLKLTGMGMRVFYAEITLDDVYGKDYEAHIFAALSSAIVMLVIGTKPEYFVSHWVKNEWSRFLHLMKIDKEKTRTLIPCYCDMEACKLPEEFSPLHALNLSEIAYMADLTRNVSKLVEEGHEEEINGPGRNFFNSKTGNPNALVKRAFLFLEDGDFIRADEKLEDALNLNPENPRAYIGKLMVREKVRQVSELPLQPILLRDDPIYKRAIRFADTKYKKVLDEYNYQNLDMWYNKAKELCDEGYFSEAQKTFSSISGHKDAAEMAEQCPIFEKDSIYAKAKEKMESGDYGGAKRVFESLGTHKDAAEMANQCSILEKDRIYAEAKEKVERGRYLEARRIFLSIGMHKDAAEMAEKCSYLEKDRIYAETKKKMELGDYIGAQGVFLTLHNHRDADELANRCSFLEKEKIYAEAKKTMENGDYIAAQKVFQSLHDHGDAAEMANQCSILEKDRIYADAEKKMMGGDYIGARKVFLSLCGHRDASEMAEKCSFLENDRIYAEAENKMGNGKFVEAESIFMSICGHKDASEMAKKCSLLEKDRIYARAISYGKEKDYNRALAEFQKIPGHKNTNQFIDQCIKYISREERKAKKRQYKELNQESIRKRNKKIIKWLIIIGLIVAAVIAAIWAIFYIVVPFITYQMIPFITYQMVPFIMDNICVVIGVGGVILLLIIGFIKGLLS